MCHLASLEHQNYAHLFALGQKSNGSVCHSLNIIDAALDSGKTLREKNAFIDDMIEVYVAEERTKKTIAKNLVDDKKVKEQGIISK